jgi:hypothetical protein
VVRPYVHGEWLHRNPPG